MTPSSQSPGLKAAGARGPEPPFVNSDVLTVPSAVTVEALRRLTAPHSGRLSRALLLHPTVVYSPGHDVLFFGVVSVPLWRHFRDPAAQDGYRFGTGVVYAW
jgi:hypothetical protein